MASSLVGPRIWTMTRDSDGHREYTITHLVVASVLDGPYIISQTAGLPLPGSIWNYDNDLDPNAFCWPNLRMSMLTEREPNRFWEVENLFSTKPIRRCQDTQIDNPLLEPDHISGSFVKYTKEAVKNRFSAQIKSSSHEQLRGPQTEFDRNHPTVKIGQNRSSLELSTFAQMVDTVNDAPLWGLPERCIKLSNASWSREIYGTCSYFYRREFEFDIDYNTFDRDILDEGTKVLHGHWDNEGAAGGSGCLINITEVGTSTSATGLYKVALGSSGGSGYPLSSTIHLKVAGGGGQRGVVIAATNGSGVVTTISTTGFGTIGSGVSVPGTGYAPGTDIATSFTSRWVLDNINGLKPDNQNPQHFDRYKDRSGEIARVILDGGGCPISSNDPDEANYIHVEYYPESNFLLLGIPTTL